MIEPKGVKWPKDKPIGRVKAFNKETREVVIDLDPNTLPFMLIAKADQDMREEMK